MIREKDNGSEELLRKLRGHATVRIGVLGEKAGAQHESAEGGAETVASIAEKHEFGIGVPERSFIRAWYDEQSDDQLRKLRNIEARYIKGDEPLQSMLDKLGESMVGEIKQRIWAGIKKPLSEMAIELRKGRGNTEDDTPLIDTGQLISSITHLAEVD